MNKKKEAGREKIVLMIIPILFLLFISMNSIAYEPSVELDLSMDKNKLTLDENIKFTAKSYINNILVLSVPMKLIITDPSNYQTEVSIVGHTNGDYIGTFNPLTTGKHDVKLVVTIDGKDYDIYDSFNVVSNNLNFNMTIPNVIYYSYGPLNINGSIIIEDEGMAVNSEVEIFLASESSPFYLPLCKTKCNGNCQFSCLLSQNIEFGEYILLGKIKYGDDNIVSKAIFNVEMKQTNNLTINMTYDRIVQVNETFGLKIMPLYFDKPLTNAIIEFRIYNHEGIESQGFADEITPGIYSVETSVVKPGNYNIALNLVRGDIFGSKLYNLTATVMPPKIIVDDMDIAQGVYDNKTWAYSKIKLSPELEYNTIEITDERYVGIINYSKIFLRISSQSYLLDVTPDGIIVPKILIADLSDNTGVLEAELIKGTVDTLSYELPKLVIDKNKLYVKFIHPLIETKDMFRYEFKVPDYSRVRFVLDKAFNDIKYAIDDGYITYYSSSDEQLLIFKKLENMTLAINPENLSSININGVSYLYMDNITKLVLGTKSYEVFSHNFIDLDNIWLSVPFTIRNDGIIMNYNVLSISTFSTNVSIYYPNGSLMLNQKLESPVKLFFDDYSPLGTYNVMVDTRNDENFIDTEVISFNLYSDEPLITITPNSSQKSVRNSEILVKHTIINNNFKEDDIVDIEVISGTITALLYDGDHVLLTDLNSNGLKDTGKIAPGESVDIFVKYLIPPNIAVGSLEQIIVLAKSSKNPAISKEVIDSIEIIPIEYEEIISLNDIEIISINDIGNHIIVNVRNLDSKTKSIILQLIQTNLDETELFYQDTITDSKPLFIEGGEVKKVLFDKHYKNNGYKISASIFDDDYQVYLDVDSSNDYRTKVKYTSWWDNDYDYRISLPFRENLGIFHDEFLIRVYVSLDTFVEPENLRIIYHDGNNFVEAQYDFLTYDTISNSGFIMIRLENIDANFESDCYIYYKDNATRSPGFVLLETDTIVNNNDAKVFGRWVRDNQIKGYYGADYLIDLNLDKGEKQVNFYPNIEYDNYEIYAYHPTYSGFADNVPVFIYGAHETGFVELNEQIDGMQWKYIGAYTMDKNSYVSIENFGTKGQVVADAFMFRKVSFYSNVESKQIFSGGRIIDITDDDIITFGFEPLVINVSYEIGIGENLYINLTDHFDELTYLSYLTDNGTNLIFNEEIVEVIPAQDYEGVTIVTVSNNVVDVNYIIQVGLVGLKEVFLKKVKDKDGKDVFGQIKKLQDNPAGGMDIEFVPSGLNVKKVVLRGVKNNKTLFIDKVKNSGKYINGFAIDPSAIDFIDGIVTRTAIGSELFKCKDWNFVEAKCYGTWVKVMNIIPGIEYTIEISPYDPAYYETGQTLVCNVNNGNYTCAGYIDAGDILSSNVLNMSLDGCNNSIGTDECGYGNVSLVGDSYIEFLFGNLSITQEEVPYSANVTFEYAVENISINQLRAYCFNGSLWELIGTPGANADDTNVTYALTSNCYNSVARANDIRVRFGQYTPFDVNDKIYFDFVSLSLGTNESSIPSIGFVASSTTVIGNYTTNWIIANVTAVDAYLANITIYLYNSSGLVDSNVGYSSPYYFNFTGLGDGTYYLNATATDTNENQNLTETRMIIIDSTIPKYLGFDLEFSTNFWSEPDITDVSNAELGKANIGLLEWNNNIDASGADFDTYVIISQNYISVDSQNLHTSMNTSANLTLYNLGIIDPIIVSDGILCDHCMRLSWDGDNLSFSVDHFTSFSAYENTTLEIFDDNDPEGGSLNRAENEQVEFYANYTLTNGTVINSVYGNCTIYFNDSSASMTYNSSSFYWEYDRSFTMSGTYIWNVSCNSTYVLSNISASDDIYINDTLAPTMQFITPPTTATGNHSQTWIVANVTASDNSLANITIYLYNTTGIVQSNTGALSPHYFNFTGLEDGTYYLNATANDTLGNLNWTSTIIIELDTVNPSIDFVESSTTQTDNYSQTWIAVNISASDSFMENITVYLYNASGLVSSSTSSTSPYYFNFTGLGDGTYYLNASVNDTAGNLNWTLIKTIALDATNPTIQFITPPTTASGNHSQTWIVANVTASDNSLANITIYLYNTTGLVYSNITSTSPHYINYSNLPDGTYYLNATANDTFSNRAGTTTNTIRLDTTNPDSVTNLVGVSSGLDWIYWSWTNPGDDFDFAIVYLNDVWQQNTTNEFFNATNLVENSQNIITIHTVDWLSHINDTDANSTGKTILSTTIVIPPKSGQCMVQNVWSDTCDGTYDSNENCGEEYLFCDDANVEVHTFKKNYPAGINMTYGDESAGDNCDDVLQVILYYQQWATDTSRNWQYWITNGTNAWTSVGSGAIVDTSDPNVNSTIDVTSSEAWECDDFFGDDATAKIRGEIYTGAGGPASVYTANWDMVYYLVKYSNLPILLSLDKSSYFQGEYLDISGQGWDSIANVSITVHNLNGSNDTFFVLSDGFGDIDTIYNISYDAPLGTYNISAKQVNDSLKNESMNFSVIKRLPNVNLAYLYYDRSEQIEITGSNFEPSENVTITITYRDGSNATGYPLNVIVQPDNTFSHIYVPGSTLDIPLRNFSVNVYESDLSGHEGNATGVIVVKALTAIMEDSNEAGVSMLYELNHTDDISAKIDGRNNNDDYILITFPEILYLSSIIYEVMITIEHNEFNPIQTHVLWFNNSDSSYTEVCAFPTTTSDVINKCNITEYANTVSKVNNLTIWVGDYDSGGDDLGNGENIFLDLVFLDARFAYPPIVNLEYPYNNSLIKTENITFKYNVSHYYYNIDECKLYINGGYEGSNYSVAINQTYNLTAYNQTDGTHQWYVLCDDDSIENNTGYSETYFFTIDSIKPQVTLHSPENNTNYTTPLPDINFNWTASDNYGPNISCNLTINDVVYKSGINVTNNTWANWTVFDLSDGRYYWNVTCWDNSSNTNIPETRFFVIDTTAPAYTNWNVSLNGIDIVSYANISRPNILNARAYWLDVSQLHNITIEHNGSTSFVEYDLIGYSGNETWANYTMNLSNTTEFASFGLINISTMRAFDLFNNQNYTEPSLMFYLWGYARINSPITINPSFVGAYGQNVTVKCQVIDNLTGTPIENYNVSFYNNSDYYGWNLTNSTGWITLNYTTVSATNFTCEIGNQTNLYYYGTGGNETILIDIDRDPPKWSSWGMNVTNGVNLTRYDRVLTYAYWVDNYRLEEAYIEHDGNSSFVNYSIIPFGGVGINESWSNYTLDLSNSTEFSGPGLINISRIIGLDAMFNVNYTSPWHYFYLWSNVNLTQSTINPASIDLTQYSTMYCKAEEEFSGNPINGLNITFYSNVTGYLGWNVTNLTGWAMLTSQFNTGGVHNISCNFTNQSNIYVYTGNDVEENQTLIVRKDSDLAIRDQADAPDNISALVYKQVKFYANYSDSITALPIGILSGCNISIDFNGWTLWTPMVYNNTLGLYTYNRSFNQTGTFDYNVSCNATYYINNSQTANIVIQRSKVDIVNTLSAQIIDRDNVSSYDDNLTVSAFILEAPADVNITFYMNLTSPVIGGQEQLFIGWNVTDSNSIASINWNPPSIFYAGNYTIYANSTYADHNITVYEYLYGGLNITFNETVQNPNSTYFTGDVVYVDANLFSLGIESQVIVNNTYIADVNTTIISPAAVSVLRDMTYNGSLWQNAGYTIPHSSEKGVWGVNLSGIANYFFYDYINQRNFTLKLSTQLLIWDQSDAPLNLTAKIYASTNFTANYTDLDNRLVENPNCTIMFNDSVVEYNMTFNVTGDNLHHYTRNFSSLGYYSWNVTCNGFNYRTIDTIDTVYINKTTVDSISPVNGTIVDRDGVSALEPDTITLITDIPYAPAGINVTYYINLSTPVIAGQNNLYVGWGLTNSSGEASLTWNPASTYYAGNYTWFANASNNSITLADHDNLAYMYIYGGLDIVFYNSSFNPNATYIQNQTMIIRANLTSIGIESETQLNESYNSNVNSSLFKTDNTYDEISLSYNTVYWNNTYKLSLYAPTKQWNVSLNSSAEFFFVNSTSRNIIIFGYSVLDVWDYNLTNGTTYFPCDSLVRFYANYTDLLNDSIVGAECNITFYDGLESMVYNATTGFYWFNRTFEYFGQYEYNVSCKDQYYAHETGSDNLVIRILSDLSIDKNINSVDDDNYNIILKIYNNRDCPINDIWAYDFVSSDFVGYNYSSNFTDSKLISSTYFGNASNWIFNFSSLEVKYVNYLVNGSGDYYLSDINMFGLDPIN